MNNESMAETIAQVANLNILDMYRRGQTVFSPREVDGLMFSLAAEILQETGLTDAVTNKKGTGDAAEAPAGESPSSAAGSPGKSEEPGVAAPTESVAKREPPATTAQDGPDKPGSNKKPEPAAGGAGKGDGDPAVIRGRAARIRDRVTLFMTQHSLNEHRAADHFDIAHPTLAGFLAGTTSPRKPTLKKIEKGLGRRPKVNRAVPPATLLKNRLENWFEEHEIAGDPEGCQAARELLGVSAKALSMILAGDLVHVNVIDQLRDKGVLTQAEWCPIRNAAKQLQSRAA
ncbi:hypothetical protein F3N42_03765 [Marinihelvus fidelis]|uniref:Uncharacterized protein n=1 Tax=Marinihelvus fidelis TaxID=2613842 RepID=A0A5N0TJI3_9GAMM|nr:hypothetical protein [Marinihelvus fidelis]KAA9133479.1 hypothetical protein F3N42_03765 [Marinihelvus fidelis]